MEKTLNSVKEHTEFREKRLPIQLTDKLLNFLVPMIIIISDSLFLELWVPLCTRQRPQIQTYRGL